MSWKAGLWGACVVGCLSTGIGHAGDRQSDFTLSYHARETINLRDNDILRLSYGIESPDFAGISRLAFFGGFRDIGVNLFASSDSVSFDQLDLGVEALWLEDRESGRHGFGARINYAEDYETSIELATVYEHFGSSVDVRFMGGVQAVTGSVIGRDDLGLFGLAETTWWVSDTFLFRVGLQADADGEIASFGFETGIGEGPVSFYLDIGAAIDGYRGISEYNDVSGGIRIALGGGRLRDNLRARSIRTLSRSVEVQ